MVGISHKTENGNESDVLVVSSMNRAVITWEHGENILNSQYSKSVGSSEIRKCITLEIRLPSICTLGWGRCKQRPNWQNMPIEEIQLEQSEILNEQRQSITE